MLESMPDDVWNRIEAIRVARNYPTAADVVRDALSALEQSSEDTLAIMAGIADMEAGRCQSFDEFDAEFRRKNNLGPRK